MKYFLSDIFRDRDTQILEDSSVNNESNSVNSGDSSVYSETNSVNSEQGSMKNDDIMKILEDISREPREKKIIGDINKMKEITLKLCEVRPPTLREFANLLDRSPDGIRNNYLSPLIEEGKIRVMYPGRINHPQQAYIAVKDNK